MTENNPDYGTKIMSYMITRLNKKNGADKTNAYEGKLLFWVPLLVGALVGLLNHAFLESRSRRAPSFNSTDFNQFMSKTRDEIAKAPQPEVKSCIAETLASVIDATRNSPIAPSLTPQAVGMVCSIAYNLGSGAYPRQTQERFYAECLLGKPNLDDISTAKGKHGIRDIFPVTDRIELCKNVATKKMAAEELVPHISDQVVLIEDLRALAQRPQNTTEGICVSSVFQYILDNNTHIVRPHSLTLLNGCAYLGKAIDNKHATGSIEAEIAICAAHGAYIDQDEQKILIESLQNGRPQGDMKKIFTPSRVKRVERAVQACSVAYGR